VSEIDREAIEAVARIINRTRAEGIPVDDDDRAEAREALEASGLPQRLREAVEALQAVALFERDGKPSPEAIIARDTLAASRRGEDRTEAAG
jgi:hypothetical protein